MMDERLPMLGQTVRDVAAELTVALAGGMPETKSPEPGLRSVVARQRKISSGGESPDIAISIHRCP
jgi:hypothetical protein